MYEIKEIELMNNSITKKRLVITFHDEEMAIVSEFLMTDASLMDGSVLNLLLEVIQGTKEEAQFSGNRCYLTINKDKTIIQDLLSDLAGITPYKTLEIKTDLLYELTNMWLKRLAKMELF